MDFQFILILAIFFIALLYSVVGHGGASGYIAVMVLLSLPVHEIKANALVLNIVVSGIAFCAFYRGGHFRLNLLLPFIITSIPFAYLGGRLMPHPALFKILVGISLLFVAIQVFIRRNQKESGPLNHIPLKIAIPVGAVIGFISGLLGIGGGIFLSPILLLFKWSDAKTAAGVSAAFIFLNSVSGLAAQLNDPLHISYSLISYLVVAIVGGIFGSQLGSNVFSAYKLKFALTILLVMASIKLIISV